MDVLPGTLDLLVLKTLQTIGSMDGWGIGRRIEQVSGHQIELNYGTLYPALVRLERQGWISSRYPLSKT